MTLLLLMQLTQGAFGGKLKDFTATELGAFASQAALKQLPDELTVDSVIFGNVIQTSVVRRFIHFIVASP